MFVQIRGVGRPGILMSFVTRHIACLHEVVFPYKNPTFTISVRVFSTADIIISTLAVLGQKDRKTIGSWPVVPDTPTYSAARILYYNTFFILLTFFCINVTTLRS